MKVGDKVWLSPTSRNSNNLPIEVTITKVGRIWAETDLSNNSFINIPNMVHTTDKNWYKTHSQSINYYVYLSKQEMLDSKELNNLNNEIKQYYMGFGNKDIKSLEDARKIIELLNKNKYLSKGE